MTDATEIRSTALFARDRSPWIWRAILSVAIGLPPVYLFIMVQYGALTVPYWDHLATAKYIIQWMDGDLTLKTFFEANSQARPIFPRLIFIFNAVLTHWDLRSEFIYIYMTVFGALALLIGAYRRLPSTGSENSAAIGLLLISVIFCSPVGAANYYWSLMLLATLCYQCSIAAMLLVSFRPSSWKVNISAAVLSWISAFSISEGLFTFPTIFLIQQLCSNRPFALNRWSLFWVANLVVCYAIYLPGLDVSREPGGTVFQFFAFLLVYVGNPLGSLLWFPHNGSVTELPTTIANAVCGGVILVFALYTAWQGRTKAAERSPGYLVFMSFFIFAVICALATAWGRASGPYAIWAANSSRYSIFPAVLPFGLLFYYRTAATARGPVFSVLRNGAVVVFLATCVVSYVKGVSVYAQSHEQNKLLADVYDPSGKPTDLDRTAYPDAVYFDQIRSSLLRLSIGPYRAVPEITAAAYTGPFVGAVALTPGVAVAERFRAVRPILRSVTLPVVTWAKAPSAYRVRWTITGLTDGKILGQGSFTTGDLSDWQTMTLALSQPSQEEEVEAAFSVDPGASVQNPVGLPLYALPADRLEPAVVDGKVREDGGRLGIRARYVN